MVFVRFITTCFHSHPQTPRAWRTGDPDQAQGGLHEIPKPAPELNILAPLAAKPFAASWTPDPILPPVVLPLGNSKAPAPMLITGSRDADLTHSGKLITPSAAFLAARLEAAPHQERLGAKLLCSDGSVLTKEDMHTSLVLGRSFMLQSQRLAGDFDYQYNWQKGKDDGGDDGVSAVREAGATWGLSFIALDEGEMAGDVSYDLLKGLHRSLDFFFKHSKVFEDGRRVVLYPGLEKSAGGTGTVAILALAYIDYLRNEKVEKHDRDVRMEHLKGFLESLKASVTEDGHVHKEYDPMNGHFSGPHQPYYDGEALLAFVKAAKYLGLSEYWDYARVMLLAGWESNVQKGLRAGEDTSVMKGYYQWSSMAWYEVLTSDHAPDFTAFQDRLVDYGLWMVNVHKTLTRKKNTGYAFEGLIPAYLMAGKLGRVEDQKTLACTITKGLSTVTRMQIGHPLAGGIAKRAPLSERIRGGVQNSLKDPGLRIDTVQHQMHAVIYALRLMEGRELI